MDEAHPEGARPKDPKPPQDGASVKSCKSVGSSSKRSSGSSVSAAAARARAKAEAARARVAFAQREISIKVDKARLQANLDALNLEKEAAAAIAQAEVLEAAAGLEGEQHRSWKSLPIMVQSTHERVSDYIRDQTMQLNQRTESANLSQISEHPVENNSQSSAKYIIKEEYIVKDCWPPPLQVLRHLTRTRLLTPLLHQPSQIEKITSKFKMRYSYKNRRAMAFTQSPS